MTSITFNQVEKSKGIIYTKKSQSSPLANWYDEIRNVPLSQFSVEDLCKSVRQELYPEYVVPAALDAFEKDPFAGQMYEGELAMSFSSLSEAFWHENMVLAERLLRVLCSQTFRKEEDAQLDVTTIRNRLQKVLKENKTF